MTELSAKGVEYTIREDRILFFSSYPEPNNCTAVYLEGQEKPIVLKHENREEADSCRQKLRAAMDNWAPAPPGIKSADQEAREREAEEYRKLQKRVEEVQAQLEIWKSRQEAEDRANARKKPKKKPQKPKAPDFIPPSEEEIITEIREKEFDAKLGQSAEDIAYSFRGIYEREEGGRTVWRKANGTPVKDWKGCLRTYISRQVTFAGERKAREKEKPKNQFLGFEQNEYDFDGLEKELAADE